MRQAGLSFREIGRQSGRPHITVRPTCRDSQEEDLEARRRGSERSTATQELEDQLLGQSAIQVPAKPFRVARQDKATRLQWQKNRQHWNIERKEIVFSGESRFCLCHSDEDVKIRRPRGQRQNLQLFQRRHRVLTPRVMAWGNMVRRQIPASFYFRHIKYPSLRR